MIFNYDIEFADLISSNGIKKIDDVFLGYLKNENPSLYNKLTHFRKQAKNDKNIYDSQFFIKLSSYIEKYIASLFGIDQELSQYADSRSQDSKKHEVKRNFVQRYAYQKYRNNLEEIKNAKYQFDALLMTSDTDEIDSIFIEKFTNTQENTEEYEILAKYAAYRLINGPKSPIFSKPEKLDFENLIGFTRKNSTISSKSQNLDYKKTSEYANLENLYCINCHKTSKDSCRTGISNGMNELGNSLNGCPLDIKISEMNELFAKAKPIAALTIICLDNPMVVFTGRRICNDCSKSCIFQKQTPVDVPSIETQIFEDVLKLPYGFEIYSLLTMWQPLSFQNYLPKTNSSKKVLVVGSGPAGATLSHYLTREGINIVNIDALKIEYLPQHLISNPVKNISALHELYDEIKPQGFGGVAEYGITDRWNKNNLIIARLILERRKNYTLHGSTKFGANITYQDALDLGFDHIALACGSGYPNIPDIKNVHSSGVKIATDFLMALGSGGAAFEHSNTNYSAMIPAIIVGCGLTAIDSAVEITKYFPVYSKKIYRNYEHIKNLSLNLREEEEMEYILSCAELYIREDEKAAKENRKPNYTEINKELGGVTICYRKNVTQSPAYKTNHEEIEYALNFEEITILENAEIRQINQDDFNFCRSATISTQRGDIVLSARSILFATGARPLQVSDILDEPRNKKFTILGDMDHNYHGSVVKAIASGKDKYIEIIKQIEN